MAQRQRNLRRNQMTESNPLERWSHSKPCTKKEKRERMHGSASAASYPSDSVSPSDAIDATSTRDPSTSIYRDKHGHKFINHRPSNTNCNPYTSPYSTKLAQRLNNKFHNYSHHKTDGSLHSIHHEERHHSNPHRHPSHPIHNGHYGARSPNPTITRNRINNSVRPPPSMSTATNSHKPALAVPHNISHFYNQPQMAQASTYHSNNDNIFRRILNHNTHPQLLDSQSAVSFAIPPKPTLNRPPNAPHTNDSIQSPQQKHNAKRNKPYWHQLDKNMAQFNKQILVAQSIGINAKSPHYPIPQKHNKPMSDDADDEDDDEEEEDTEEDESSSEDFDDEPSSMSGANNNDPSAMAYSHDTHSFQRPYSALSPPNDSLLFSTSQVTPPPLPPPPPPPLYNNNNLNHHMNHRPETYTQNHSNMCHTHPATLPNSAPHWNQFTGATSPGDHHRTFISSPHHASSIMTPPNDHSYYLSDNNAPPPIDHTNDEDDDSSSTHSSEDGRVSSSSAFHDHRRPVMMSNRNVPQQANSPPALNPVASMPFTNNWRHSSSESLPLDDMDIVTALPQTMPNKPVLATSFSTSDINRLRSNCKIDRYGFPLKRHESEDIKTDDPKHKHKHKHEATKKKKKRRKKAKKDKQRKAARKEKAFLLQWQNILFPSSTNKKAEISWTDLKKKGSVNYKIRSLIKSGGIPQPFRSFVWSNFCAVDGTRKKAENKGLYERLLEQNSTEKNKYEEIIWKDIHRTFRANLKYGAVGMTPGKGTAVDEEQLVTESQETLYNVLSAFSIYNKDIGYCQGMQAISALLLMYMIEEDVFFMLNTIARSEKYGKLCTCWNMQEIHLRFAQFEYCFKEYLPKLYKHLSRNDITDVSMFGTTAWFITIFISSSSIEFDLIVRIWDVYLWKGIKTVFKFGIGYLKYLEKRLLKVSSFEILITTLNNGFKMISENHDNEKYIQMALNVNIKHKQIEKWAKKYHKLNPT